MRFAVTAFVALLATASFGDGDAAAQGRAQVVDVITATNDVHDIAVLGDRTLVIRRGGEVERVLGARHGLVGERLRSVSVLGDEAFVGGVEGAAIVSFDDDGTPRVSARLPLRRVRRAVRFGDSIWAGTYGDGLFRLRDGSAPEHVSLGPQPARARITDLVVRNGELFVATAGSGLLRVGSDGRVRGRIAQGLADLMIWDLEPVGDRLLVATLNGISVIGSDGAVESNASEARSSRLLRIRDVRSLHHDGAHLFSATHGAGVYRLDAGTDRPTRLRHRDGNLRVRSIGSAEGTVLIGYDGGLAQIAPTGRLASISTGGLPSADVTAVARAFGSLWIGTFDGGLACYTSSGVEAQERAAERFHVDGRINDLAVTGRGAGQLLWIATDRGLFFHDGRRFTPVEDPAAPGRVHVTSLDVDRRGTLWVTSSRMLSRHRNGQWRSWSGDPTFPVVHLHAVATDRHDRVWVGSLHGLYRFDEATGTFERHTTASGALPVDWVTALEPWRDGVVVGTYHGGLSWTDGTRFDIERVSAGGLPAGWVNPHAMRFVGNTLFVGTLERGLLVGSRGRWTQLTTADGLPSADVTDIIPDGDGAAWVATRGGLARITY